KGAKGAATASRPVPRPADLGAEPPGKVSCPHCGTSYPLPARAQGKRLRCPRCQQTFQPPQARTGSARRPAVRETAREVQAQLAARPEPVPRGQGEAVPPPDEAPARPRRRVPALVVGGGVAALLAVAVAAWLLRPGSPPEGPRTTAPARAVASPPAAPQLAP